MLLVDAINNLQMPRQHAPEERQRPALECFRQERVVGVGQSRDADPPGLVPRDSVQIDEDSHQLGDGNARMCVIELNRSEIG